MIWRPQKRLSLLKKGGSHVLQDVQGICERSRENLSMVLSSMCAFGNPEAKAIINEIVEDVALKKGVKRMVEELVGDETFSLYVESLQVPDWVSPYFKTKARISGNTWQADRIFRQVFYVTLERFRKGNELPSTKSSLRVI